MLKRLAALARIAATESLGKYAIEHLRLLRKGDELTLQATDGWRMVEATWHDEGTSYETPMLIPGRLLGSVAGMIEDLHGSKMNLVNIDGRTVLRVWVSDGQMDVTWPVCDPPFPDTEQAYPKGEPTLTIRFDARYLAELLEVIAAARDEDDYGKAPVTMEFYSPKLPCVVSATGLDGVKVRGAIMPMALPKGA